MDIPGLVEYWKVITADRPGTCGPMKAKLIIEYCELAARMSDPKKPIILLEIGVLSGKSLIAMCLAGAALQAEGYVVTVVGVDAWSVHASITGKNCVEGARLGAIDYEAVRIECGAMLYSLRLSPTLIHQTSFNAMWTFPELKRAAFIHFDGNGSEYIYRQDVDDYASSDNNRVAVFEGKNASPTVIPYRMMLERGWVTKDICMEEKAQTQCHFMVKEQHANK